MELRELEAFVAVSEELHFGRAAERLHMTQPPLSQRIRSLERQLGFPLFDRNTRTVTQTIEGQSLYPAAREVLHAFERFKTTSAAMASGSTGRLRIGFSGAATSQILPILARDIRAEFPDIDLVINGYIYSKTGQELIRKGQLDLAFSRLPIEQEDIGYLPLYEEELIVALPDTHPLANEKEVDLEDLASETFITFPADSGSMLQDAHKEALEQTGLTDVDIQEATDSYTILSLVAAGAGVSLTLSSVRHVQTTGIVYRRIAFPKIKLQQVLIWDSRRKDKMLRNVLELCAQSVVQFRKTLSAIDLDA
ncbi:LysR family transcriptional regulator [Corynebacterium sp. S7]